MIATRSESPVRIHITGAALFLFIPLVLFLFLRYPFGVLPSFGVAVFLMFSHRLVARPFFLSNMKKRCLWCGRTSRPRTEMHVQAGQLLPVEFCVSDCDSAAKQFFGFAFAWRPLIAAGIFVPLAWYVITMILTELGLFSFPVEWNRFLFQLLIAITVVTLSFAYRLDPGAREPKFTFPIHNLFLLGIRNTLLVFRIVGIWWIAVSFLFLWSKL